mgnify:CR=1 FL=1
MKKLTVTGILTLSIGLIGSAVANPISWDTNYSSGSCSSGVGNACTYNKDGYELTARAYSTKNNSGTGKFEKATITRWSGGIGVKNPDQWNEGRSPNHSLDDSGRDELIVFENNAPGYTFTGFEIGWRYHDSDLSAWVGDIAADYDFTGKKFSDLAGLGFTKINFSNVPTNTTRSLGANTGNHLLLAPREDGNSEYVKISQINGEATTQVSEPGMLALFGIALVGFLTNRRRKIS